MCKDGACGEFTEPNVGIKGKTFKSKDIPQFLAEVLGKSLDSYVEKVKAERQKHYDDFPIAATVSKLVQNSMFDSHEEAHKAEIEGNVVNVKGTMGEIVTFNKAALRKNRDKVREILALLPESFEIGDSLLRFHQSKTGKNWGDRQDAEFLYLLSKGLDLLRDTLPEQLWMLLPGGMPLVQIRMDVEKKAA
jgi:hypothetical protein